MGTAGSQLQPHTQAAPKRKEDCVRGLSQNTGRKDRAPNAALMCSHGVPVSTREPRKAGKQTQREQSGDSLGRCEDVRGRELLKRRVMGTHSSGQ